MLGITIKKIMPTFEFQIYNISVMLKKYVAFIALLVALSSTKLSAQSNSSNPKVQHINQLIQTSKQWDIEDIVLDDKGEIQYRVYMDSAHTSFRSWTFNLSTLKDIKVIKNDEQYLMLFTCKEGDCIKVPPSTNISESTNKPMLEFSIKSKKEATQLKTKLDEFSHQK